MSDKNTWIDEKLIFFLLLIKKGLSVIHILYLNNLVPEKIYILEIE